MVPKPLSEFPRPPQDNGRGVHWSASVYHPTGADLQFWIDELKAMQIKWVKALDDGGGSSIELCQALLDNDIMPVVRVYRERPNPGHIGGREQDTIERLIAGGVRYIETNNEPDLPAEWENNHRPDNWLDIVVDNFIYDADVIQGFGGLPAFPAMGPGSKANGIAKVVSVEILTYFPFIFSCKLSATLLLLLIGHTNFFFKSSSINTIFSTLANHLSNNTYLYFTSLCTSKISNLSLIISFFV